MKKDKIPFVCYDSKVPVVKFYLADGTEGYALVDTGSESTVFDKTWIKDNKKAVQIEITENKLNTISFAGDKDIPIIRVKSSVIFEPKDTSVFILDLSGMVMDLSGINKHLEQRGITISAIIGADALSYYGAKLDFNKRQMILDYDLPRQQ